MLAGCAQAPRQTASKEYFPESVYGRASDRVVGDGADVPKGGGKYLVGKPYSVAGRTYVPSERSYAAVGAASWYGDAFHGRRTANGEIYDKNAITAAHPTMPLPSYARVTNLRNSRSIIVRVNDRGPYHGGRIMDLSAKAAEALDYKSAGTARVRVEYVGKAAIAGSDDRKLLATLRTDGQPAQLGGGAMSPTMVAEQDSGSSTMRAARLRRGDMDGQSEFGRESAQVEAQASVERRAEQNSAAGGQALAAADATSEREGGLIHLAQADTNSRLGVDAPLPPPRPFDLGTIPGAGSLIAAGR